MLSYSIISCIALLSTSAVALPIDTSLAAIMAALSPQNTTQTNNATWVYQNNTKGACGLISQDSDLVAGLPLSFYNHTGSVSPYCGQYVVITSMINNMTVTARVADASNSTSILSLSVGAYEALNGTSLANGTAVGVAEVEWIFANSTQTAAAEAAVQLAHAVAISNSAQTVATPALAPAAAAPVATVEAAVIPAPAASPPAASSPAASSPAASSPAPSSDSSASSDSSSSKSGSNLSSNSDSSSSSSSSSQTYSGMATFYYQGGAAGACGTVHDDSALIVAIDSAMYNGGSHCGKSVKITTSSGSSVTAVVADMCPGCSSAGSLDLSVGAFDAIGSQAAGTLPISWSFA